MPMDYSKLLLKLKEEGISTYWLRENDLIGQATLMRLRNNQPVRTDIIARFCCILKCQPNDIMEYIHDDQDLIVTQSTRTKK